MNKDSKQFIKSLQLNNLSELKKIPKSDLHNHFALGGNRDFIFKKTGHYIPPLEKTIHSMQAMHD